MRQPRSGGVRVLRHSPLPMGVQPMRRRPSHQEPLTERVDKAGIKECCDPDEARHSRAQGRVAAYEADGNEPDPFDVEEAEGE